VRVLLDTNIVLDVLLERRPFINDSAQIWQAVENKSLTGCITASSITDIFYIVRRQVGLQKAHDSVETCLSTFEICPVDRRTLELAVTLEGNDFEDKLQFACASVAQLDAIVSRDKQVISNKSIPSLTPSDLLAQLATS
jgi:predicted nucleic acid-binding protein